MIQHKREKGYVKIKRNTTKTSICWHLLFIECVNCNFLEEVEDDNYYQNVIFQQIK